MAGLSRSRVQPVDAIVSDIYGALSEHMGFEHCLDAVACALRFVRDAHPGVYEAARWPALTAHADRCEALPAFQTISQVFIPPSS